MKRKSKNRRQTASRKTASSHFTSVDFQQLRRKILQRKGFVPQPLAGELLRLARHLSEHCETCWQTVDQLISSPLRPYLHDPFTDAVVRLTNPRGGEVSLTEDHRQALREVRDRPYGFAYVVFDEAMAQGLAQAMAAGDPNTEPEGFVFWSDLFLEDLKEHAPDPAPPELVDIRVYAFCNLAEMLYMSGGLDMAQECLENSRNMLPLTSCHPRLEVRLLEVEAQFFELTRQTEKADECYRGALGLLGPGQSRRRFEIRSIQAEMLFRRKATPEERYVAFESALAELSAEEPASPMDRVFKVHEAARLTRQLAQQAHDEGFLHWPGIAEALEGLEQTRPLYLEHVDRYGQELAEAYKADLQDLVTKLAPMSAN